MIAYMVDVVLDLDDVPPGDLIGVVPVYKTKRAAKHACPDACIDEVEVDDEENRGA